jgi:MFS family permease
VSGLTATAQGSSGLYLVRFFLGIAQGGLFPGLIFFLTLWFPDRYLARRLAWINSMMAAPAN